jgi:hypothetical protein
MVINHLDMHNYQFKWFDNKSTAVCSRWRNPGDETNILDHYSHQDTIG